VDFFLFQPGLGRGKREKNNFLVKKGGNEKKATFRWGRGAKKKQLDGGKGKWSLMEQGMAETAGVLATTGYAAAGLMTATAAGNL